MSMRYAAADPEKKVRISVQYVDEDAGSDNQFSMDVHDDEPLGIAVQYLLSNLEALRDEAKASRAEEDHDEIRSHGGAAGGHGEVVVAML
ncbi:hypothetical protein EJB05_03129 [Eragrostis curvula]|nr:hypothetical protein EJB05_03129 [Eragrostis curvula]